MKTVVLASALRSRWSVGGQEFHEWHGSLDGTLAAMSCVVEDDDLVIPVFRVGADDIDDFLNCAAARYHWSVRFDGLLPDPLGTNLHVGRTEGEETFIESLREIESVHYQEISPFLNDGADLLLLNPGDVGSFDDDVLERCRHEHPSVLVLVDVHRKINARSPDGRLTETGWPGWRDILRDVDVIQMSRPECRMLCTEDGTRRLFGTAEAERFVRDLIDDGFNNVAVTLGPDGCVFGNRGAVRTIPAVPCRVADTLGAGDAFGAAAARAMVEGKTFEQAVTLGMSFASLVVRRVGRPSFRDTCWHDIVRVAEENYIWAFR